MCLVACAIIVNGQERLLRACAYARHAWGLAIARALEPCAWDCSPCARPRKLPRQIRAQLSRWGDCRDLRTQPCTCGLMNARLTAPALQAPTGGIAAHAPGRQVASSLSSTMTPIGSFDQMSSSSASPVQYLHVPRTRSCSLQPDCALHSLHVPRVRPCSQICDPPQSLQWLRWRPCSQICDPPHSLHRLRCRPCSHICEPPQALHALRIRPCGQIEAPPQSLQTVLRRPCEQIDPFVKSDIMAICKYLGASRLQYGYK